MEDIFGLLKRINKEPGLYLGTPSVTALRHFLVGYKFARQELNIMPTEAELDFYREFQPWLQRHFQFQTTNAWDKILLFKYLDETTAFSNFFKLLDLFRQREKQQEIDPFFQDDALATPSQVA
ncbi:MAG: hypothetical protein ABG776_21750 [Cyanobacteria bacterium J06555_13]